MEFLIDNWFLIVCSACCGAIICALITNFVKQPNSEKLAEVKAWLLHAVIWAEREYQSGMGKAKLSAVYGAFCGELPWIAKVITFEKFSTLVDEALVEMKALLKKNQKDEASA